MTIFAKYKGSDDEIMRDFFGYESKQVEPDQFFPEIKYVGTCIYFHINVEYNEQNREDYGWFEWNFGTVGKLVRRDVWVHVDNIGLSYDFEEVIEKAPDVIELLKKYKNEKATE